MQVFHFPRTGWDTIADCKTLRVVIYCSSFQTKGFGGVLHRVEGVGIKEMEGDSHDDKYVTSFSLSAITLILGT